MLPSLLFLLAPPLAAAAPRLVTLGANEQLDILCQAVVTTTVVSTVTMWKDGIQTTAAVQQPQTPASLQTSATNQTTLKQSALTNATLIPSASTPAISLSLATSASVVPTPAQFITSAMTASAQTAPTAPAAGGDSGTPHGSFRNALYFANWGIYGANFQPQQIPVNQISHVLYAFADIGADGTVKSSDTYADLQKHYANDSWNDVGTNAYGCIKQLYLLKKQNRGLKVLLSIGGWTYSPKFAPIAASPTARATFASSAVRLVADWGLDGLDIDWEYPASASEAANFVLLLAALRTALDAYAAAHAPGYHFLLTIAAPAGPTHYATMDLEGMDPLVDAWHLMAYDYAGSWDSTTGHQANLYASTANPAATKFSTEKAVADYVARGIKASKIDLGMPLYGRAFDATAGLGDLYNGVGQGTFQSGVWLYRDLPRPGATEMYDPVAGASYSYDAAAKELVTYDNVGSAVKKAQYLVKKGLGGAVFWEASGDKVGAGSLVGAVAKGMGGVERSMNLLAYPISQYDNIRKGMQ